MSHPSLAAETAWRERFRAARKMGLPRADAELHAAIERDRVLSEKRHAIAVHPDGTTENDRDVDHRSTLHPETPLVTHPHPSGCAFNGSALQGEREAKAPKPSDVRGRMHPRSADHPQEGIR